MDVTKRSNNDIQLLLLRCLSYYAAIVDQLFQHYESTTAPEVTLSEIKRLCALQAREFGYPEEAKKLEEFK